MTSELTRDEPTFDGLLVQGAKAMQALASRSEQLTQLISNTSTATGAIARQSQALEQTLTLLPPTLTRATHTFHGLQTTLDALNPLVAASKPAVRQTARVRQKAPPAGRRLDPDAQRARRADPQPGRHR